MGPYVLRICFLLGIMAASLSLALVYSASSRWIAAVQKGSNGPRLFGLTPAEAEHYSHPARLLEASPLQNLFFPVSFHIFTN